MAVFRFLLFFLAGYLILKLIGRYVIPWLGKKAMKKAQSNMREQMEKQRSGDKIYESGNVTIRKSKSQDSKSGNNSEEEYIDFEEVD